MDKKSAMYSSTWEHHFLRLNKATFVYKCGSTWFYCTVLSVSSLGPTLSTSTLMGVRYLRLSTVYKFPNSNESTFQTPRSTTYIICPARSCFVYSKWNGHLVSTFRRSKRVLNLSSWISDCLSSFKRNPIQISQCYPRLQGSRSFFFVGWWLCSFSIRSCPRFYAIGETVFPLTPSIRLSKRYPTDANLSRD